MERVDILLSLRSRLEGADAVFGALGKMQSLLYAIAASAPVIAVRHFGDMASEIKALAGQSGISTDALQVLTAEMEKDSVKAETLSNALVTLRRNLQEAAANPNSPLVDQLRALRLTAEGLQALRPEQQLELFGQRILTATNREAAFGAALDILGSKTAPKLLESLKRLALEGYDSWKKFSDGLVISDKQLEDLDTLGNQLARIWKTMDRQAGRAVADFASMAKNPGETLRGLSLLAESGGMVGTGTPNFLAPFAGNLGQGATAAERSAASGAGAREGWLAGLSGFWNVGDKNYQLPTAFPEDPMHGRAFTPASIAAAIAQREAEAKMQAAEAAAQLKRIEAQGNELRRKSESSTAKMLADIDGKLSTAMKAHADEVDAAVQKYRELGDATLTYKKQIAEVNAQHAAGLLTDKERTAVLGRLNAEMNRTVEKALNASNDALRGFGSDRARVETNPFLTNREKNAERIRLLKEENAEIARQISLLRELQGMPGVDPAQLAGQIRGLEDRATSNDVDAGRSRELETVGENMRAELVSLQNEWGTVGENIASTFGGAVREGMGAAQGQLQLLIGDTEFWSQKLGKIGGPIMGAITQGIAKMFVEWIAGRAASAIASMAWSAKEGAADTAAKTPGAILTSISSYGVAAAIGLAAVVAALASGAFADGGVVRGRGGPREDNLLVRVSNGEGILNERVTSMLGEPFIDSLNASSDPRSLFSVRSSAGAAPVAAAGGGRRQRDIVLAKDMNSVRELMRDPDWDSAFVGTARNNRGDLIS